MQPCPAAQATMEDLLERVLDKGIVVRLDLVIGVAGIPLIGISLHAAIAAIETMVEYGLMNGSDAAASQPASVRPELQPGEHPALELYGSVHHARGIFRVWRPGRVVLTDRRLLVFRPADGERLFEAPVGAVTGIGRLTVENAGAGSRQVLCLALDDGGLATLYVREPDVLEAALRARLRRLGQPLAHIAAADIERLGPAALAQGQLWHRCPPGRGPQPWKSGWAVLTPTELAWRPDSAGRGLVSVPLAQIRGLAVERHEAGRLGNRQVLLVTHGPDGSRSLFAGDRIDAWSAAIERAASAARGRDDA